MNEDTSDFMSDAVARPIVHDDIIHFRIHSKIETAIDLLSREEYISIFFLLLEERIKLEDFPVLVKKSKDQLKSIFLAFCRTFDDEMLYELFGTIKRFDILKELGTCSHVFNVKKSVFCQIKDIWKLLYCLCEEMTDTDRMKLERKLFPCSECDLHSTEEMFCVAVLKNRINKTDITHLELMFQDMPSCQTLIKSYLDAERSVDYYEIKVPTIETPCGLAVIFNHDTFDPENNEVPVLPERKGSQFDVAGLKRLWRAFGFKTIVHENKTDSDVLKIFNDLAEQDHTCYDVFIACYLSHGDKDIVYASNNRSISITTLKDIITNKCGTLQNKPKLFFIQACQGQSIQALGCPNELSNTPSIKPQTITTAEEKYTPLQENIPLFCDSLTVMSTIPGYMSFRSEESGSLFIQSLIEKLQTSGEQLTIEEICKKVTDSVSKKRGLIPPYTNCKQTVLTESTLRKQLKLKKLRL